MSCISIENLKMSFGVKFSDALKNINAKIDGGKITGLVGPDGAGKTTLLRLICGLLVPAGGRIIVNGFDTIKNAEDIHLQVGYMPQRFGLYEDLTVAENMELHADLRNVPRKGRSARYDELLSFTGLSPFTKRLAGNLSGGMKQKLGLACTLFSHPPVLLLDEPGVGVDPVARRELWKMVNDLATPERIVIWSTAYLDEAEMCGSVLLLNNGELLYDGCPDGMARLMEGRVFKISGAGEGRRSLIAPLMEDKNTLDTVIQGASVRVVTHDNGEKLRSGLETLSKYIKADLTLTAEAPRFEDSFMEMLGGIRNVKLGIADFFHPRTGDEVTVKADRLTKRFGNFTAVNEVSFSIRRGEIFGLLGPNGAGKSTTFKMMCGLLRPTEGDCSIAGFDFKSAPGKARSRLGYMAQKFSLYGDLNVLQNLKFFSGIYNLGGKAGKAAIERVIETFALSCYLDVPSQQLPLGIKQRLAMGCAIMHDPDVLFLDEPTSGVDPVTRREFWTCINSAALNGITVMVTTHFMDEAEYCDRIALVYDGQTIAMGTTEDLKKSTVSSQNPDPTMEDAFISLIENSARR